MSLDDFFAKKTKKAKKGKINPLQLLEQITNDTPQPLKNEVEKKVEDVINAHVEDNEDWDPIVNDDVELDLANMRISDLSVVQAEKEQAVADTLESANKSDESKVVWGGKTNEDSDEEPAKEEQPIISTVGSTYVLPHLRAGGNRITNLQAQPNLESAEEFPSLDAAAQEKPKKAAPSDQPEIFDNSWTEVNKHSQGHGKIEDSLKTNYVPPSDVQPKRFTGSYSQKLEGRFVESSTEPPRVHLSTWVRGDAIKGKPTAFVSESSGQSGWTRGGTTATSKIYPTINSNSDGPKAYVIPSQRKIADYTQANRFAQLDESS